MYLKRLNSIVPFFHACTAYICEENATKNWWTAIQAFTVIKFLFIRRKNFKNFFKKELFFKLNDHGHLTEKIKLFLTS